uniref:hypothetical protein n=1 Tax=Streptococcus pseudopneumoniae TaxID=257758 RepID=UPI0019557FC5
DNDCPLQMLAFIQPTTVDKEPECFIQRTSMTISFLTLRKSEQDQILFIRKLVLSAFYIRD